MRCRILVFLFLLLCVCGCKETFYQFDVICERIDSDIYRIKWEVFPVESGELELYYSTSPEYFDRTKPFLRVPIEQGRVEWKLYTSYNRPYFLIVLPDESEVVVGVQNVDIPSTHIFRDLGGYRTIYGERLCWGRIYRSGNFKEISHLDANIVHRLQIQSLIDLTRPAISRKLHYATRIEDYYHFPIINDKPFPKHLVMNEKMSAKEVRQYMMELYRNFTKCHASIRSTFDVLKDANSYPLVLSCEYGHSQSSFVTALLFHTLGIPMESAMEDYLANNQVLDILSILRAEEESSALKQDALMTLFISEADYLEAAFAQIRQDYGSVDQYLQEAIGLDKLDYEILRERLLQ